MSAGYLLWIFTVGINDVCGTVDDLLSCFAICVDLQFWLTYNSTFLFKTMQFIFYFVVIAIRVSKMSSPEKLQRGRISWLCSTDAKREFYLSSSDLDSLVHRYRHMKKPSKGRPVKLWNSEELRQVAEEKYGKEAFQAKVDNRAQKRHSRNQPVFNDGEKFRKATGSIKKLGRRKKTKPTTHFKVKNLAAEQDTQNSSVELEGLCDHIKKCDKEQLEQIIAVMAQKNTAYLRLFDEVKQVALLPRSKFQLIESNIAKLLSTSHDEKGSQNAVSKEDNVEKNEEDEQEVLNMELEGTWKLRIVAPLCKSGEEGSLEVVLFGSGLSVNGDISFPTSCVFGDLMGFKTDSYIQDPSMYFETRSKMCDNWYTGALQVFISRDGEGLRVSGSFWPGFKEQDATNTFQFTGRKADV